MENTVHFKRGTKSLGKHSEFEALVQVKQTVHHSETTARTNFQKKKGKSVVDPSGGGETAGTLILHVVSSNLHIDSAVDCRRCPKWHAGCRDVPNCRMHLWPF